jgi:hypothetical protein
MPLGHDEIDNRFGLHPGGPTTIPMHNQTRREFISMANFLDKLLPDGRAKSLAFTALQEASMWSNFAIAELAPVVLPEHDVPEAQPKLVMNLEKLGSHIPEDIKRRYLDARDRPLDES